MFANKKMKLLICFITLSLMTLLILLILYFRRGSVSNGITHFRCKDKLLIIDDLNMIFDTGSTTTWLKKNPKVYHKLIKAPFFDAHKNIQFASICTTPFFSENSNIQIKRLHYTYGPNNYYTSDNSVVGIAGTNVICKANWLFSFNDSIVRVLDYNSDYKAPQSSWTLDYNCRRWPCTKLQISGITEKFLIDMGCYADMILPPKSLKKIIEHQKISRVENKQAIGIFSNKSMTFYTFDSIELHGIMFKNISIGEGEWSVIGLGILTRFDSLYIDSKHKRFCLWNNE